jgi:exodeoxyribonuclease VII small subunit
VRGGVNQDHHRVRSFKVARVKNKPPKSADAPVELPDFEKSLSELEALVQKLEQGDVPLEEALQTFERGVALTRQCQTALQGAQQKVEMLLSRSGEEQVVPFDDAADEDEDEDDDGRR